MRPDPFDELRVRDATADDLTALTQIKPAEALHRDRLCDAQLPIFRYLVLDQAGAVIGFACLVFVRPSTWSDAGDTSHLPQIVDVQIAPRLRGRGYGSYLLRALEQIALHHGYGELFLALDPLHNPRALALYRRLGYHPLQTEPYLKHWEFVDSGAITTWATTGSWIWSSLYHSPRLANAPLQGRLFSLLRTVKDKAPSVETTNSGSLSACVFK